VHLGRFRRDDAHIHRRNLQSLALNPGQDFSDQPSPDRIRLD
jgi:hypothetical protein